MRLAHLQSKGITSLVRRWRKPSESWRSGRPDSDPRGGPINWYWDQSDQSSNRRRRLSSVQARQLSKLRSQAKNRDGSECMHATNSMLEFTEFCEDSGVRSGHGRRHALLPHADEAPGWSLAAWTQPLLSPDEQPTHRLIAAARTTISRCRSWKTIHSNFAGMRPSPNRSFTSSGDFSVFGSHTPRSAFPEGCFNHRPARGDAPSGSGQLQPNHPAAYPAGLSTLKHDTGPLPVAFSPTSTASDCLPSRLARLRKPLAQNRETKSNGLK
jgi:hypothetical protein